MTPSRVVVTTAVMVACQLVTLVMAQIPCPPAPAPEPECEPCPENEVYSECGNHPCLNTCAEPDLITRCDYVPGCYPGCICKPGFLRDPSGNCICEELCCGCGGDPNAQFTECGDPCPYTCDHPSGPHCELCLAGGGCACKAGYVKDNGRCILPSECPCADSNAELVNCPNPCPGGTCEQPEFSPCPRPFCDPSCTNQRGCQCKAGYVKDVNDKCILLSQCSLTSTTTLSTSTGETTPPVCDDPNAELLDCPNPCPGGTCEHPKYSHCTPRICYPPEDRGCQCKNGYVKDINGKCILLSQCPPRSTTATSTQTTITILNCKENEVFNPCPGFCTFDQDCYTLLEGIFPSCSSPLHSIPCSPRCECLPGFVRLRDGRCGLPDACCNDPFAELIDCPLPCNQSCPGVFSPCPQYCAAKGCRCRTGMVRNELNECVFRSQCPCADPNSEWLTCPNRCPGGTCEQPEFSLCPGPCFPGCQCRAGYVKNDNGECILFSQCPSTSSTLATTSTAASTAVSPVSIIPESSSTLTPTSTTIAIECDDPNAEVVDCPNLCPGNTCEWPDFWPCPQRSCFGPGSIAWRGCQCNPGYVKNENDTCILLSQCGCADPNAELVVCPNTCPGGTCEQPLFTPCSQFCLFNQRGCQCKGGYVKDVNGVCVLLSQCPSTSSTRVTTSTAASTPEITPTSPSTTLFPGCADPNAEVVICPNPCPGGTCEQPDFLICPRPFCENQLGCQCKAGYVKDVNGECIPLSQCPTTSSSISESTSTAASTTVFPATTTSSIFESTPTSF